MAAQNSPSSSSKSNSRKSTSSSSSSELSPSNFSALDTKKISSLLGAWYKKESRSFPWRESKDPYKVWISEIMLQQTGTKVVRSYFENFISLWPSVKDLSAASIEEVYKAWQGLGYYSRARNILKAAKIVTEEYDGTFPRTAAELLKLPGIGPYTSRAISSICFEEKVGVVDGNVLRVHNRLLGKKIAWWEAPFFKKTQAFSDQLCNYKDSPSQINQALMDLGSTVCSPKSPTCLLCPLTQKCNSFKAGVQKELPLPKKRKAVEHWLYTVYKTPFKKSLYVSGEMDPKPVLKKLHLPFGKFKRLEEKPKSFAFSHSITKHKIYVTFRSLPKSSRLKPEKISINKLREKTPSSLVEKIWHSQAFREDS